ncbi:carboxypeptidase-like regulatory domain-containing protein [Reichenbachiella carrageenanivorans]|uniref:Carboxypeptidase-like regulatory domain-containing protein n=1 Tax=Reichenbachiella carrageenanivorans TaxID=2979869 RepID=A0ABY6CZI5_9BACT|nr:carboxypeptidase-like regulatory domain-containing protein [Reichenbachiella carrageenanivorans]UXX79326.1 carboxypeptidase-like regulatory domain-containing protein [Reichenbachiella carrageenanivorans]
MYSCVLLLVVGICMWSQPALAQKKVLAKKLQIDLREVTIDSALNYISYKTNVFFSYSSDIIDERQRFTIAYDDSNLEQVLHQLLLGTGVEYTIINGQIILFKSAQPAITQYFFEKVNIRGNVRDAESNAPIPGINVYVAGTLKGSATDINGNFELKGLTPGPYEIVFSHIVYNLAHATVTVQGDQQYVHIPVKLEAKTTQLENVEIIADSEAQKNWDRGLKVFEKEFFGNTQNADKCSILNAEVLDIDYDRESGVLKATAELPLIIENLALGYRINYILEFFEHTPTVTRLLGISNFEELPVSSNVERKRIIKNREKSYQGSMTHFLRSLTNDKLKKEGFVIDEVDELPSTINNSYFELPAKLHAGRDQFAFDNTLKFSKYLLVIYTKEYESAAYVFDQLQLANTNVATFNNTVAATGRNVGQMSFIKLNLPVVTINSKGFFNEPLAVTTYGYWSWERVAEYMPFEYEP